MGRRSKPAATSEAGVDQQLGCLGPASPGRS